VTPRGWRLARQVLAALGTEVGMTDQALAAQLDVSVTELKPVLGMLLGRGQVESCAGFLVLVTPLAEPSGGAV
jgi:hypothetical protein